MLMGFWGKLKKNFFLIILTILIFCFPSVIASAGLPKESDHLAVEKKEPGKLLPAVALRYNEKIPYDVGGRYWGLGFKMHTSFDNSEYFWTGSGDGLDSEGYVLWLIRQCFGYSPDEIMGGIQIDKMDRETYESLEVGDICVKTGESGTVYGIVACFKKGKPIVTLCDSQKTDDYVCGCSHFCYARDEDGFFDGYRPVDFQEFYRLPSGWKKRS